MEFSRRLTAGIAIAMLAGALEAQPIVVRDGTGATVRIQAPARRVASLMSSSIDIIVALGAADRIVARTRYDTASAVRRAADVGGGIDPSVETLLAARPDLFVAWQGQASSPVVSRMRALGIPVYLVETRDTAALYRTVRDLGTLLGLDARAGAAADALRKELRDTRAEAASRPRMTAVYVISRSPVIISAATSYIAELISVAGADNPYSGVRGDFPTMSLEAFIARNPDVVIMARSSTSGGQLAQLRNTPGWRDLRAVRSGAVVEVDGEQWGRPTLHSGALVRALAAEFRRLAPVVRARATKR